MGGETDVLAGLEQGGEQQGEGGVGLARAVFRHGEEGGELGVVGELRAGVLQRGDGGGGAAEADQARGVAGQDVGLFGGGGKAEHEGAFVGGERLGVRAGGGEGEGQLGRDLGHVRVAGIEPAQGWQHGVDAAAVAGADDGVEFGFPSGGHGRGVWRRRGRRKDVSGGGRRNLGDAFFV